jgi:hypothetical protein
VAALETAAIEAVRDTFATARLTEDELFQAAATTGAIESMR